MKQETYLFFIGKCIPRTDGYKAKTIINPKNKIIIFKIIKHLKSLIRYTLELTLLKRELVNLKLVLEYFISK